MMNQLDTGPCCPMSINYAATPTMRQDPALAAGMGAAPDAPRLRPVRAGRHGDDGEAGRLGPARKHHRRRAGGGGVVRAHRAQVVLHASRVRGVLDARAGAGRHHLLRRRAPSSRLSPPAFEGQAGRALPGLRRGRVRPPSGPHPRGGGPRHGIHDRADRLDADRHDGRRRGDDAAVAERGGLAHAPPQRVRRAARLPARDGERARGPRARSGGRRRGVAADRARLRRGRSHVRPHGARGHEVLDLQARRTFRGRGARMPGRERLHRDAAGAGRPVLPHIQIGTVWEGSGK